MKDQVKSYCKTKMTKEFLDKVQKVLNPLYDAHVNLDQTEGYEHMRSAKAEFSSEGDSLQSFFQIRRRNCCGQAERLLSKILHYFMRSHIHCLPPPLCVLMA